MLRALNKFTVRDLYLSVLSAILLFLSFPNFNLSYLAWVAFVPLFFALKGKSKLHIFLLSYLAGIAFWLGCIYWLAHVTCIGMFILVLYLGLYFGFFGLIINSYELLVTGYGLFVIPSAWVILEYLRSHLLTGFPWALLGYSQYKNLPVIQVADISGAWGVSFLVMLVNALIFVIARSLGSPSGRRSNRLLSRDCFAPLALTASLLFIVLLYGFYKLNGQTGKQIGGQRLKISVIQGNIPQELKWDARAQEFIISKYSILSAAAVKDKPDLIIWPEASYPLVISGSVYYGSPADSVKEINTPLLFGAVTTEKGLYYNSALLVSRGAGVLGRYDKIHLVPFGEYIPFKNIFPFLETIVPIGDIAAGKEYVVFEIRNQKSEIRNKFSVLICFEDLFPELSRQFVKRGAEFLVNITNDAWYKETNAPYQHLQASVFRAIENRVFLIRAANTGISGFINPLGRIISLVKNSTGRDIFVDGYDTEEISLAADKEKSAYTRYGDLFILLCIIIILCNIINRKWIHLWQERENFRVKVKHV